MSEKSKPETKKQDRPDDDRDREKGDRSYYYDDAHGYEDFDPEEDEEEFEE